METEPTPPSKRRRRGLVLLVVVVLGLAAYFGLANHRPTYRSAGGEYSLQYPDSWEPVLANGVVVFSPKANPSEYKPKVSIVLSAMAPDWQQGFEASLASAFAASGIQATLLQKSTLHIEDRPVASYAYALSLNGRKFNNTVYVFEIGKDKAAVMTCSGPQPRDSALEAQFLVFVKTFGSIRVNH